MRKEGLVFKIDLEKVHSHVEWDFDLVIVISGGSGCGNLYPLLHSLFWLTAFCLVFGASRGLWQGDPLSSFLFTIMPEPMGALLVRAMDCWLIKDFEASWNGKQSTCLQFAIYIICLVQQ